MLQLLYTSLMPLISEEHLILFLPRKAGGSWHDVQGEAFLQDVHSGAFQAYAGLTSLQQAPCGYPPPCNITVLQTVALKALHHAGEAISL